MPTSTKNVESIKVAEVRKREKTLEEAIAIHEALKEAYSHIEAAVGTQQDLLRTLLTSVQQLSEEHLYLAAQLPGTVSSPLQDEITREELDLGKLDKERKALAEN